MLLCRVFLYQVSSEGDFPESGPYLRNHGAKKLQNKGDYDVEHYESYKEVEDREEGARDKGALVRDMYEHIHHVIPVVGNYENAHCHHTRIKVIEIELGKVNLVTLGIGLEI